MHQPEFHSIANIYPRSATLPPKFVLPHSAIIDYVAATLLRLDFDKLLRAAECAKRTSICSRSLAMPPLVGDYFQRYMPHAKRHPTTPEDFEVSQDFEAVQHAAEDSVAQLSVNSVETSLGERQFRREDAGDEVSPNWATATKTPVDHNFSRPAENFYTVLEIARFGIAPWPAERPTEFLEYCNTYRGWTVAIEPPSKFICPAPGKKRRMRSEHSQPYSEANLAFALKNHECTLCGESFLQDWRKDFCRGCAQIMADQWAAVEFSFSSSEFNTKGQAASFSERKLRQLKIESVTWNEVVSDVQWRFRIALGTTSDVLSPDRFAEWDRKTRDKVNELILDCAPWARVLLRRFHYRLNMRMTNQMIAEIENVTPRDIADYFTRRSDRITRLRELPRSPAAC